MLAKQFKNTRNKHAVHRGWIALAKDLGKKRGVGVTSKQCQDKMKAIKQQWAEYKRDISRTGNDTDHPCIQPKNLETNWGASLGMDAESLFDSAGGRHRSVDSDAGDTAARNSDDERVEGDERGGISPNKRLKVTTATAISEGLHSLSKGMAHIGDSLAARSTVTTDLAKLTAAVEAQQVQLSKQTESIQRLIELLMRQQA